MANSLDFDRLRQAYPSLGLALYALEPGGPVTLEVYADDTVYPFTGPTAKAAIDLAFPTSPTEVPAPTNIFD